jgi:adenosylcobinamide-phosphate synthase
MLHLSALLLGFMIDLIVGDPQNLPHTVRYIGKLIEKTEILIRPRFPKTERGELAGGALLLIIVAGLSTGTAVLLLWLSGVISIYLRFAIETLLCWQLLAVKSLRVESMKVYRALKDGNITAARKAVSMIVGRDTEQLDEAGIARAAVETVAESASDGIIAPLIFMAVGGAPLGILYKAINTMDSMVGYKNDKYLFFGRAAAKTDDVLNFIPARLAGALMCAAAYIIGLNGAKAIKIFLRDRRNHKSPNSAHTEAACAGALGIRLGGTNIYFGKPVEKPYIGDALRPVDIEDIKKANRLMYATAALGLSLFCLLPLLIISLTYLHMR